MGFDAQESSPDDASPDGFPVYTAGAIIETVKQALTLPIAYRRRLVAGGFETAKRNRPAREYRQFVAILKKTEKLWKD